MKGGAVLFGALAFVFASCSRSDTDRVSQLPAPIVPYAASDAVRLVAAGKPVRWEAADGDNWPITWAQDGSLYAGYGDGWGTRPLDRDGRINTGIIRIDGTPPALRAEEIPFPWFGAGATAPNFKGCGLLDIGGTLYHFIRYQRDVPGMRHWRERPQIGSLLVWSDNQGRDWQGASYSQNEEELQFFFREPDGAFATPFFLQAGRAYSAWHGPYAYVYSPGEGRRLNNDTLDLARVPRRRVHERSAYEFFAGMDDDGQAKWTNEIGQRQPVLTFPNHVSIGDAVFVPPLQRILLVTAHANFAGPSSLHLFESTTPWGPWAAVGTIPRWGSGRDGDYRYEPRLPAKWIAANGRTLQLVYSDRIMSDKFNHQELLLEKLPSTSQRSAE